MIAICIILLLMPAGAMAARYQAKYVRQGQFEMELIRRSSGISVASYLKSQEKVGTLPYDVANCTYFWRAEGKYWPVGLLRDNGKDHTSKLMPSRGYAYLDKDGIFKITTELPPKDVELAIQGHNLIENGIFTNKNGGFDANHWRKQCPRTLLVIRRDEWGVEYVGIVHATGGLKGICTLLLQDRVVAAVNLDGGSSCGFHQRVANLIVLRLKSQAPKMVAKTTKEKRT